MELYLQEVQAADYGLYQENCTQKQLLNLYAEKSLLQSTFERLNKFIPSTNIISVTNSKHHANVKMQLDKFNGNSIVLPEPVSKNTAPAIALSVKYIVKTVMMMKQY